MIPPLAGRDAPWPCRPLPSCISIHPPLAGRDSIRAPNGAKSRISIHPPLAGRDRRSSAFFRPIADFNPPVPCGAGPYLRSIRRACCHFNPPASVALGLSALYFNPPAPCGAGPPAPFDIIGMSIFQSTRPLRGGTEAAQGVNTIRAISIHPSLAGRDRLPDQSRWKWRYFNPPAPCGAGPCASPESP